MSKNVQTNARRYRRTYERVLKKLSNKNWNTYKSESLERGQDLTEQQRDLVKQNEAEWLERKQQDIIKSLKDTKLYTNEQIDEIVSKWLDGLNLYADKW